MRTILVAVAALQVTIYVALAQSIPQTDLSKADLLSMDQKVTIGTIITDNTPPTNIQFSPIVGGDVPSQIPIQLLPAEAEQLAPQLHGYGCVVFEELIAIVSKNTRKVALVIPRWRQQENRR